MLGMSRTARLGLLAAAWLAVFLAGGRLSAQGVDPGARAVARDLGYAGVAAFERADYATAVDKLERAFKILEAPSLGLWSARALVKTGRLVQARERYRIVGRIDVSAGELEVQRQAQRDAAAELTALEPRIPFLVLLLEGASPDQVTIDLDGAPFAAAMVGEPRPVDPGSHKATGKRGDQRDEQTIVMAEGEKREVKLHFMPVPAASGAGQGARATPADAPPAAVATDSAPRSSTVVRTLGWTALGVGAAGIAVGAITGIMAMNDRSSLRDRGCNLSTNQCPPGFEGDIDAYNDKLTVSTIGLIGGGVLAAAGAIMLLTLPKSESAVSLRVSPQRVALAVGF
jgi:hypothetical protein